MINEKIFLHNLGKEICAARKLRNMSQADLAEKADLSVTYVSKIECGHRNISVYTLARIAEVLGIYRIKLLDSDCENKGDSTQRKISVLLKGYSPDEIEDIAKIIHCVNELIAKRLLK